MIRQLLRIAAAMIAVFGCSSVASAQRPAIPLDTLLVTATSRAAAEIATGTRAVEVISADQIRRSPARTVGELLQWAFGVDAMPRSTALVDVGIRGSSFEQVLVLVDGIRASDAQTGHFDLDLAVPLDQIERIEIVRGAGSALHGADAMGGVIHVVTRRSTRSAARLEGGTFETANLALSHGLAIGAVNADLGLDLQRSDGHRTGTDYETGAARLALSTPVGEASLSADVAVAARNFGADGFYGAFPSYERTRTGTASMMLRSAPGSRLAIEPAVSARWHHDDFILRREEPAGFRNKHSTLQVGAEVTARYALSPLIRFAAGVEGYNDRLQSERLGDRDEMRGALVGELVAGRVGAATGTVGLRVDHHETFGTFVSPSVAAAVWPVTGLRLRASAGRAFRTPTWTERYYQDPANIGDPNISPEEAWVGEAAFDAYPIPWLRLGATAFIRDAEDLIDWAKPAATPAEPWRTRNVENATYRGLEFEAGIEDLLGVRVIGQGSLLSLRSNEASGFTSKYALRPLSEVISVLADRAVTRGINAALRARAFRRRGAEPFGNEPTLTFDARLTYQHALGRLYVDLQNLGDEQYPDITNIEAAGRTVLVGLEFAPPR